MTLAKEKSKIIARIKEHTEMILYCIDNHEDTVLKLSKNDLIEIKNKLLSFYSKILKN